MMILLALSGCFLPIAEYEPAPADIWLCLGLDRDDLVWDYDSHELALEGELVGLEVIAEDESAEPLNLVSCPGGVDLLVQIKVVEATMEEAIWTVGIGLREEAGSLTPSLDLELGQTVSLDYLSVVSFGDSQAMTLSDADGVVFAADQAQWGVALGDEPMEGLDLSEGEVLGEVASDCGLQAWPELVFETAGGALALASGATGELELDGQSLTALHGRSYRYLETNCADLADQASWALWR